MRSHALRRALFALVIATLPAAALAGEPGTLVLGTHSFWRTHTTFRPMQGGTAAAPRPAPMPELRILMATDDGKAAARRVAWGPADQPNSPAPPVDWTGPDFDDRAWWRSPGPFYGGHGDLQPLAIAVLSLRGKFRVDDPAAVRALRLSVTFRGGLVAYLNGKEVARAHMSGGPVTPETPAEDYPAEAFFTERDLRRLKGGEKAARYKLRVRRAEGLALPVAALQKGVNVLALEIHRATLGEAKPSFRRGANPAFNTCGLLEVALTASGAGFTPNVARPKGFQVWNADLLDLMTVTDYGEANEPLRPVRIVGTRGGVFSGQVAVGSDATIKGLRAEASPLAHEGGAGTIPAARVRVRFPRLEEKTIANPYLHPRFPWKDDWGHRHWGTRLPNFDTLDPEPPAEIAVQKLAGAVRAGYPFVEGAVQTIWMTVAVPPDAAPGAYTGTLTVRAEGAGAVKVPVRLEVGAWKLPDPKDFSTLMDFFQSPESLALYYKVPLWSEKHFALVERTFELLGTVGADTVYVPLIAETHLGNGETLVRWAKKADGTYDYDFGLAERYLDLAEKHLGRPKLVCFHVWDYHIGGDVKFGRSMIGRQKKDGTNSWVPEVQKEIAVTGAGGAALKVPSYLAPGGEKTWGPLGAALGRFVRKRGLEKSAVLGIGGDILPSKEIVEFWRGIYPESRWMIQGHGGWAGGDLYGAPVAYTSFVYSGVTFGLADPETYRYHGWNRPRMSTLFARGLAMRGAVPAPTVSYLAVEWNVAGEQQGLGRLASDFFRIPRGKRPLWLPKRYNATCSWKNAGLRPELLAPGPEGARATARFQLIREGLQACEARIFIERALLEEAARAKLGEALAARCQELLDEHTRRVMWVFDSRRMIDYNTDGVAMPCGPVDIHWYAASGWQDRAAGLYAAAAEVAGALKK